MKRIWLTTLAALTLSIVALRAPAAGGSRVAVADAHEAAQAVAIRDVKTQGDVVSGVLTNPTSRMVRDVGLLIRHTWFWTDEHHPGRSNPGRAALHTVAGPIPPGGSVPFAYRAAEPLPVRSDGHFGTTVEVVTFSEAGSAEASR